MDIPNHSFEDSDNGPQSLSVTSNNIADYSGSKIPVSIIKEVQESTLSDQEAKKEKKKAKWSKKKQVVQEEERERGKVSMKVYFSYMDVAYKGLLIPLIVLSQALFQGLQIASNWWMEWANPQTQGDHPKTSSLTLLAVYTALAFGSSWFIFIRAVLVATFGLAAAQKLFLQMLRSIFRAPMSFFDSTPAGRILNRTWWLCFNYNTTTWHSRRNDEGYMPSPSPCRSHGHCLPVDSEILRGFITRTG